LTVKEADMTTGTMRSVRYLGPAQSFALRAVAIPEPATGQVRVRVEACGMCRTELHLRDGLLDLGRRDFAVGHEIAGVIEKLGAGVNARRLGERVVVYYYEGCGQCRYCRTGDEQLCPAPLAQPGFTTDGGYAEFMVVRATNCVKVPDDVPLAQIAPMGCAGSTAVHAGKMAGIRPGEWVVVHGTGGVGLALLQYAASCGARTIAIDIGVEKLALAKDLGASVTIDAGKVSDVAADVAAITGEGADVVFELVGLAATMRASMAMLRRRGRLVLVGYTGEEFSVHPVALIVRELVVLASVGSTLQDLHDVVDLVAMGKMKPVVDYTLPLAEFARGLEAVESGGLMGRVVLLVQE
jgi:propanol-preferring alcohol dehydrogenase